MEMYNKSSKQVVEKLISDRDREILEIVNFVFIISALCLFGMIANVMNILVFYKQGFNNTMNITFFGLAISDLLGLLELPWLCVCLNPLFAKADTLVVPLEIQYLTGGIPHDCFSRITGWITVFITAERCLCIMIPLKIKQIITPNRTILTVCIIYLVIIFTFIPEYLTTYIDWKFYPEKNRTLLGLVFTSNRESMEGVIYVTYSVFGSASFVAVIILTVVLVVQLKQKSKWRKKANADKSSAESISIRERKTVTMVIMIATVLIICYIPGAVASLITAFEPQFAIVGKFVNAFVVLWSFVFIFQAINSSVNIFLYYNMSTKYRETFNQVFAI